MKCDYCDHTDGTHDPGCLGVVLTPRPTSVQAYREIKSEGLLGELQRQVLLATRRYGPGTAREICSAAHIEGGWKRFSELARDGFVREEGERRCAVTGRKAIVWRATT